MKIELAEYIDKCDSYELSKLYECGASISLTCRSCDHGKIKAGGFFYEEDVIIKILSNIHSCLPYFNNFKTTWWIFFVNCLINQVMIAALYKNQIEFVSKFQW